MKLGWGSGRKQSSRAAAGEGKLRPHWRGESRPGWEDSQVSGRGEGKEEEREEEPRAGSSPSPKQSQDSRPGGERGGREIQEQGNTWVHTADSLHCTAETNTTL